MLNRRPLEGGTESLSTESMDSNDGLTSGVLLSKSGGANMYIGSVKDVSAASKGEGDKGNIKSLG